MPSFAYSGHRHEQHAPFTAPATRFVEFLTPVESLKKHRRWSQVTGQSSSVTRGDGCPGLGPTREQRRPPLSEYVLPRAFLPACRLCHSCHLGCNSTVSTVPAVPVDSLLSPESCLSRDPLRQVGRIHSRVGECAGRGAAVPQGLQQAIGVAQTYLEALKKLKWEVGA